LAELVAHRNRLVLEFFPQSQLRTLMDHPAPQSEYWYARRPCERATWILVDERGFPRRSNVSHEDTAAVQAFLAEGIGVAWSDIQACVANTGSAASSNSLVLQRFRVSQEFPPVMFDEECYQRGRRRELFRLRHYRVIPAGHLVFPEV
jgi:hypothetical protein